MSENRDVYFVVFVDVCYVTLVLAISISDLQDRISEVVDNFGRECHTNFPRGTFEIKILING